MGTVAQRSAHPAALLFTTRTPENDSKATVTQERGTRSFYTYMKTSTQSKPVRDLDDTAESKPAIENGSKCWKNSPCYLGENQILRPAVNGARSKAECSAKHQPREAPRVWQECICSMRHTGQ